MKTIIIYASFRHGNTEKIAKAIGSVLGAETINFIEADKEKIMAVDLLGFGSGVYYVKFHKGLLNFVKGLPDAGGKKAFIFSTAGMKQNPLLNRGHRSIRQILQKKNFKIVGEFDCPGYDTNGLLKYLGGVNKGRPNEEDMAKAKDFAKNLCPI
jgi:flavodoxin